MDINYIKARNLYKNGQFEKAVIIYHNLINCSPKFSWYYYDLGRAYQKSGKLEKAIQSYCCATQLNPELGECYCDLGKVLLQIGRLEDAIKAYRCAIELKPKRNIKLSTKSSGYKSLHNMLQNSFPSEEFFMFIGAIAHNIDINELILITSYFYPYKNKFNVIPYKHKFYSLYKHLRAILHEKIFSKIINYDFHSSDFSEESEFNFFLIVEKLPNSLESSHSRLFFDTLIKIKNEFKKSHIFIFITNESFAYNQNDCFLKDEFYSTKSLENLSLYFKRWVSSYLLPDEFDIISVNWNAFGKDYYHVLKESINFIKDKNPRFVIFPGGLYCSYVFSSLINRSYPTVFLQTNRNDPVLHPHTLHITHGYRDSFADLNESYRWRNCFRSIDIYELEQLKIKKQSFPLTSTDKKDTIYIVTFGRRLEARLDKNFIKIVENITSQFEDIYWDFVGFTSLNNLENSIGKNLFEKENCHFHAYVPYSDFKELLSKYDVVCAPNHSGNGAGILNAYLLGLEIFCFANSDVQSLLLDYSIYNDNYESYYDRLYSYLKKIKLGKVKNKKDKSESRLKTYMKREENLARKNLNILINEALALHQLSCLNKPVLEIGKVKWNNDDLKNNLVEFCKVYDKRPIQDNKYGMKIDHLFATWFLSQQLLPENIVESGVYRGQSTWVFEQASPNSHLFCLDPNDTAITYCSKKATYYTGQNFVDFYSIDWSNLDKENTLCLFDDHYGTDRIIQAYELGFKHILYGSNYCNPGGHNYHPSGNSSSPKASFKCKTDEAIILREIIEVYYEFPPIAPNISSNPRCQWSQIKDYTKPPLLTEEEIIFNDFLKPYEDEAFAYTWICYIRLKSS
ncbi:tetratricopeptide repeat protein [Limnospira platensis CENA597]|uniref:tetratricopeptide repeat protein n=2 Tax=Limnospira platensis TaxID=118562 RepID=UPI003DA0F324